MECIVIPVSGWGEPQAPSVPEQEGLDPAAQQCLTCKAGELGACWSLKNMLELSQTFQYWVCLCRRRGLDDALFPSPCFTTDFWSVLVTAADSSKVSWFLSSPHLYLKKCKSALGAFGFPGSGKLSPVEDGF